MISGTKRIAVSLTALLLSGLGGGAMACVEGDIRGEMVTAERTIRATGAGESATFHLLGAGWLRAAEIVKLGGDTDNTSVALEIDGEVVFDTSFAHLKNPMYQLNSPYIVANVKSEGRIDRMTIWYSPELKFRAMVLLRVGVEEDGVESVRMRTVMNKPAPHEHLPGQGSGTLAALPAFK
jgi:hypothetical protein